MNAPPPHEEPKSSFAPTVVLLRFAVKVVVRRCPDLHLTSRAARAGSSGVPENLAARDAGEVAILPDHDFVRACLQDDVMEGVGETEADRLGARHLTEEGRVQQEVGELCSRLRNGNTAAGAGVRPTSMTGSTPAAFFHHGGR